MEKNLRHLEATVDERTADLEAEKWTTESLLLKMLPRYVRDAWVRKRCANAYACVCASYEYHLVETDIRTRDIVDVGQCF